MSTVVRGGRRHKTTQPVMASKTAPQDFLDACKAAGVPATQRQLSKFRNGYGLAARAVGRNHRKDPLKAVYNV
jgi:hypothetical protein